MTLTPESLTTTPLFLMPIEARVLATLMEKARTVPDSYPLSLNALLLGCNQKTTREPVMDLSEADIADAINTLKEKNLARDASASRVARFEHNFQRGLGVPEQSAVLLGVLMLRGPQTAAELRLNTERWYKFADVSSVEGFLDELQERSADKGGALVVKLAKAPGAREQRWAHLLCGPVDVISTAYSRSKDSDSGNTVERIERLEAEVANLRETVRRLCTELGMEMP